MTIPSVPTLAALVLCLAISLSHQLPSIKQSPVISSKVAKEIPGHYLVVLNDDIDSSQISEHHNWLSSFLATGSGPSSNTNEINHIYDLPGNVRGYSGKFDSNALNAISQSHHVAYIEKDQVVSVQDEIPEGSHNRLQNDAPWGLSRISHHKLPTPEHYNEYPFSETAGSHVSVYVIDTGININHVDFEGRAVWGTTIPQNDEDLDGNGHGTHCAGTIAGRKYGVAKQATPIAVKVLSSNGSGTMSDVVKGVEWAIKHHKERQSKDPNSRSVANMSLGGGSSRTLDRVVNGAVEAGIHFAVAAGNDNKDACQYSPAGAEKALTVGATSSDDGMAWFSNVGSCVDIFAPGKDILSTWIGSNTATNTISGTSMASPHVAGVLAYLSSQSPKPIKPSEMKKLVLKQSTKNVITGLPKPGKVKKPKDPRWPFPWPPGNGDDGEVIGKTPNKLLFTGFKPDAPAPEPEVPDFSSEPVSKLTVHGSKKVQREPEEDRNGVYTILPFLGDEPKSKQQEEENNEAHSDCGGGNPEPEPIPEVKEENNEAHSDCGGGEPEPEPVPEIKEENNEAHSDCGGGEPEPEPVPEIKEENNEAHSDCGGGEPEPEAVVPEPVPQVEADSPHMDCGGESEDRKPKMIHVIQTWVIRVVRRIRVLTIEIL